MHYYIDGYNLLFRTTGNGHNLQEERTTLINQLARRVSALGLNITVIFDSTHNQNSSTISHTGPLEIIYTNYGETADAYILSALKNSHVAHNITIITSDKPLADYARRLGAKSSPVEHFLRWLEARFRRKQKKHTSTPSCRPIQKQTIKPSIPIPEPNIQGVERYEKIFEERLKAALEKETLNSDKKSHADHRKKRLKKKASPQIQAPCQIPESDFDRWLRLFENQDNES